MPRQTSSVKSQVECRILMKQGNYVKTEVKYQLSNQTEIRKACQGKIRVLRQNETKELFVVRSQVSNQNQTKRKCQDKVKALFQMKF